MMVWIWWVGLLLWVFNEPARGAKTNFYRCFCGARREFATIMENDKSKMPLMKLKQILKSLLEKHDMTVVQLARKTSVPKNTLFNWLSGMKPKDVEQAKRVAEVFNVSLDFLLFGEQSPMVVGIADLKNEINAGVFEVILRKSNSIRDSKNE
jgi:transcriptional regulator with XRE-family HTH domain